ncbi:hypothetical protein N9L68_00250 [bacterium]|nr:hypothetical protein [bacterium]
MSLDPGETGHQTARAPEGTRNGNPADMMTKHLARHPLDKCMLQFSQHRAQGRAQAGLDIQGDGKDEPKPACDFDVQAGEVSAGPKYPGSCPTQCLPAARLSAIGICDSAQCTSIPAPSGGSDRVEQGAAHAPRSVLRDRQESDQSVNVETGGLGHKRRGAAKSGAHECTHPVAGWPERRERGGSPKIGSSRKLGLVLPGHTPQAVP